MNHLFRKEELTLYLLATFFAVCACKVLMVIHFANWDDLAAAAYGVIEGRPHWIAFQNRLMGPYTVLLISKAGISFKLALALYHAVFLEILVILIIFLLRREGVSRRESALYLVFFLFVFLAYQHYWFYTWDSIDLIVFTSFAYGIIKAAPTRFFFTLFLIGLANRESALFIALYVCLNSFQFQGATQLPKLKSSVDFLFGIALLAIGLIYTKLIRTMLFVSKPDGLPDTQHEAIGNHVYVTKNITDLFITNFSNKNIIASAFIIFPMIYFWRKTRVMSEGQIKALVMSSVLILNILVFGILSETRMLFILIPFYIFLWVSMDTNCRNGKKEITSPP